MSDLVTELHIVGDDNNIFDTNMEYIIPLYQRAYAWEDKQLVQLIEDINDVADDANYYIGALIVSRQGNKFEVVDGQQRLTSLYLLLNCLGYEVCKSQYKNAGFGQNKNVVFPTFLFCLFNHHQSLAEADLLICRKDH